MKKEKKVNYFDELEMLAEFPCQASLFLLDSLKNFKMVTLGDRVGKMHEIEHTADIRKHEMSLRMVREFMTPIDREDIVALAQALDNITDQVEEVLMKLHAFNVRVLRDDALIFADLLVRICHEVKAAMGEFKKFQKSEKLNKMLERVHSMEREGDMMYAKIVQELYRNSRDPVELLIWTQIYDCLEESCDTCEEAANVIESVVMKNT